jgi:hypothetical protein
MGEEIQAPDPGLLKPGKIKGLNLCGWVARKSLVRVEIQVFV